MRRPRSIIGAWLAAPLLVALTLGVSLLLQWRWGVAASVIFVIPVALASWIGGLGPGLFATLLSALAFNLFMTGHVGVFSTDFDDLVRLSALIFVALIVNVLDSTRRRVAQERLRDREQLLVTLASIGDAVIATDADGCITFMNRIAEKLTGWSSNEAMGKALPDVFDIIDENTCQPIPNPVEVALRENRTVELSNSTVLRSKSGVEIPIEDSAAPICDEQDKVSGVVLVFRDVGERKRREGIMRFIAQATAALNATLDYDQTFQTLAELAVPALADWCVIDLVDEDGRLYEAALAGPDLASQRKVHDLRMAALNADPQHVAGVQVLADGKPLLIPEVTDEFYQGSQQTESGELALRAMQLRSILAVPLKYEAKIIGVFNLIAGPSGRVLDQDALNVAEQLADRAAIAIEHARLFRDRDAERERLRVTLASIGDAVIATDTAGHVMFMNPVAQELTGWTQADALDKLLTEVFVIVNEETRETVESPVTKVLREGMIVGLANHTVLIARDGAEIPIDDSGAPIRDAEGTLIGVILVFRDIRERKAAEAQMEYLAEQADRERRRLQDLISSIPGVVWEARGEPDSESQRITYVSEYVVPLLGYSMDEWLNTSNFWRRIVHPDDKADAAARARRTFGSIIPGTNQFRWITKDGRELWMESHSRAITDAEGNQIGMRGVTFDISARKETEELLREQSDVIEIINRVGRTLSGELELEKLLQSLTDAATQLTGAQFGTFFYNVTEPTGESYLLFTLSGASREQFEGFPMPHNTPIFGPTFSGTAIVRSDDITQDPRYGKTPPYYGMPEGHLPVRSYLAIPVKSRSGAVIGGLFFGHEEVGVFTEREEQIIVGLAAQAAIAIDNATLYREAQDQRERLRVTLGSIGDAVIATDAQGRVTFVNAVAEHLTGWKSDEAVGQPISEIFHILSEDSGYRVENPVQKVLAAGEIVGLANHTVLISRDGDRIPIDDSGAPIRAGNGTIIGVILVFRDIRERKAAERRRDAYARQQAVIANLGQQALLGLDLQQLMDEGVRAVSATLKLDCVKVLELLPGEEELLLRSGIGWNEGLVGTRRVSAGTGSHGGYTLLTKAPVIMDDLRTETRFAEPLLTEHECVSGISALIEGAQGRPWGVLGAHTRQHRTFSQDEIHFVQAVANILAEAIQRMQTRDELERALDRTRELYKVSRQIGEASSNQDVLDALARSSFVKEIHLAYIVLYDKAWGETEPNYVEIKAAWQRDPNVPNIVGMRLPFQEYGSATLVDQDAPVIILDVHEDARVNATARSLMDQLHARSFVSFPLVNSGQVFGVMAVYWDHPREAPAADLPHLQGLVDQASATLYNLLLVEQEQQARRAAEKADALKMKFLAMISHELRTPLTSIKGFTTTLLSEDVTWDTTNQQEFLSIINEESDNLTELIEQLLDLSRLEANTLNIHKRVQPLHGILSQAMPQLFIIASKHQLEFDLPNDLPLVNADGRRITQVISNIVANAAKYSPEDTGIRITAEVDGDYIQINVIDQGPGIPDSDWDAVFEAFRQAENRPRNETKGAGLGLAISRGLIEAHGGQIWISESGPEGTTVSFTLPIAG